MKENAKDSPVSIRFGGETSERLEKISAQTGIAKAEIIRRATEEYLARIVTEGRIVIPLIAAEANGNNNTVIINHGHHDPKHYKISKKR